VQVTAKFDDASGTQLSFAEELMWQADLGGPGALPFFDCPRILLRTVRLQGPLNQEALMVSLGQVVQRHDVLRSRFVVRNGQPVRLASQPPSFSFTIIDRQSPLREDPYEIVEDVIKPRIDREFDLAHGPLVRAILVVLAGHDHILAIAVHHIVFDRWSKHLLELELKRFYCAYLTGRVAPTKPLPAQYHDYVVWQRQQLDSERGRKLAEYWADRLTGLPALTLPCDTTCGPVTSSRPGTSWFTIPIEAVHRLIILSRQSRATLATTMLAIFMLFLYKVSGVDDVAVGVPLSDRRRPQFEQLIGLFMNVVVVRTSIANGMTFLNLLDLVRRNLVDACLHQDLPYGYLLQTNGARPPYRIVFNFMSSMPASDLELVGVQARPLSVHADPHAVADLSLHVCNESGALLCRLLYKADLFSEDYGRKFATQIEFLTKAILQSPQNCIDAYDLG
jgi:hypothetical protein